VADASRQPCIVGIAQTEYRRWGGFADRSELALACEAVVGAAADAGLPLDRVDGLCSYAEDRNEPALLQGALGLPALRFASLVWGGHGTGSCAALQHAAGAVRSGAAAYVVVLRALCQGQGARYGRYVPGMLPGQNFLAPFGMFSPPAMVAPLVQRYMHEYGIRAEHLGEVALTCRDNASRNPHALLRDRPLTMQSYLASRMIASPLRLYDCCQENDGACALLVTSLERARDLRARPVRILAAAHANNPGWGTGGLASHNMPLDEYGAGNGAAVARQVFGAAGLGPRDIDVAQIYDHFTGLVLMTLENFGFCARGEGGAFVETGAIRWPGGALPINTSGGHLAEAYIHGLNLAVEGVRQLRGASSSQVEGAQTCLVTAGLGGPMTSALILGA
jgi:acetyl-CoA acetyltransferase